ncbi:outer membrane beta-barrel protein [Pseudohalocynthiibacter aestuariivivens]|uniref:Outer membrane beta-barrel protein n=1 Tax=Pseudohalocynthiibacter aestuariivivens TaxID=1591409 RepID=A0ABV5JBQ0_9RHOB|nr:outer membrane beta-barrel protein [Pseudohalocynthiibacter aestuariivivens]MBS9718928.1 outer membrane beta-barrel protein [Pseudohalocynthiibacter aestuariivivens]
MQVTSTVGVLVCSGLMSFAVVSASAADESVRTGQSAVQTSTVKLIAGVTLTEQFTDNVFLTSNDRRSDFVTTFAPWASLSMESGDFKLDLEASAEIGRYSSNSSENYEDFALGAEARYRLREGLFAFGGLDYAWDHEERNSPDDVNGLEPTDLREASGFFGIGGTFDERSFRLGVNLRDINFDDTPAAGGAIINNDDRDRLQTEIGGRLGVRRTANGEVFVQGIYNQREYDSAMDDLGFQRDSQGIQAAIGYTGRMGDLTGEVLVGALSQSYDDARFETVTTPVIGADLTWRASPNTRVTGEIERTIEETTLSGASSYISTTAGARIRHRVAQNMSIASYFFLTQNDYQGVGRTDHLTETGVGLRYYINPKVYVDADYAFRQRLSDVAGAEFDEHRIYLGVGAELQPRYQERANSSASASSTETYVGVQIGDSALQTKLDGPRGGGGNLTANFGDRGFVGGVFAGYRANFGQLVLGVEAEIETGDAEWTHVGNRNYSVKAGDSYGLSGIAGFRTKGGNLLYGRFGVTAAEFESQYQQGGNQAAVNDREIGFNVGLGAEFPLGGGLSGRMEYQIRAFEDYEIGAPLGGGDDDNFANVEGVARFGLLYVFGAEDKVDVAPVDFSGFYAGGQLGHGTLQSENSGPRPNAAAPAFTLFTTRSGQGFTAGVLGGYGHQFGSFYIGGEAELELSSAGWNIERDPVGRIYSVEKLGTVGATLRAGYVVNESVLIYGRAGLVRSKFNTNYQFSGNLVDQDDYLTGVRIGGGVELSVSQQTHLRLDYTHTNYDAHQVDYGVGVDQFDTSENLFRVGLSYQF